MLEYYIPSLKHPWLQAQDAFWPLLATDSCPSTQSHIYSPQALFKLKTCFTLGDRIKREHHNQTSASKSTSVILFFFFSLCSFFSLFPFYVYTMKHQNAFFVCDEMLFNEMETPVVSRSYFSQEISAGRLWVCLTLAQKESLRLCEF